MRSFFTTVSDRVKAYLHPAGMRAARVLVVDDEAPILGFVRRVLEPMGCEVHTAESGRAALALAAQRGPFDVLVTDLVMPHMNGDELARLMRAATPDLKVLYLTGFSDQLFKQKVALWHDEAFLDKPASIEALQQAVAILLYETVFISANPPTSLHRQPKRT